MNLRIGHGYDVHRLVEGRKCILGGVEIAHETGLLGHSDADVLVHAVMDALLGAAALGDIGKLFPDTDPQWKGADSLELLRKVRARLEEAGWQVGNIDATIIAQAPRMAPHIETMRQNIAAALDIAVGQVNVKATTEEKLGFTGVREVALGADMVAYDEAAELSEKGFLTSSCCPAFVKYLEKQMPQMLEYKSHNLSPMAALGKHIKEREPDTAVVFIGPCIAKKSEIMREEVRPYIDCVLTFEELQALLDSRDIDLGELEERPLDDASYYGRVFARTGGLAEAVARALKEQGSDFELKAVSCDGIEQCRAALMKASKNVLGGNFIEGMACTGGCIGGAGCLTHGVRNRSDIDRYAKQAGDKGIFEAIRQADRAEG